MPPDKFINSMNILNNVYAQHHETTKIAGLFMRLSFCAENRAD